ncbi:hypothetical protein BN1708_019339, partial [Verticillium longisporum]
TQKRRRRPAQLCQRLLHQLDPPGPRRPGRPPHLPDPRDAQAVHRGPRRLRPSRPARRPGAAAVEAAEPPKGHRLAGPQRYA